MDIWDTLILDELRDQVNGLNTKILDLINERTELVQEIGKVKEKQGVNRYDPIREREMLNFLKEYNQGSTSKWRNGTNF